MTPPAVEVRRVLVTGSRDWRDREMLESALQAVERRGKPGWMTLVHGGQRGADAYAHSWARRRSGWFIEVHPANWQRYGRRAGPIRNAEMVESGVDLCVAFLVPGSKGAIGCALLTEQAGVPVWRLP